MPRCSHYGVVSFSGKDIVHNAHFSLVHNNCQVFLSVSNNCHLLWGPVDFSLIFLFLLPP